jgi:arginase family enzyme
VIRLAVDTGSAVGVEVTIFNPVLDRDGSIAAALLTGDASALAGEWRPAL